MEIKLHDRSTVGKPAAGNEAQDQSFGASRSSAGPTAQPSSTVTSNTVPGRAMFASWGTNYGPGRKEVVEVTDPDLHCHVFVVRLGRSSMINLRAAPTLRVSSIAAAGGLLYQP